MSVKNFIPTLWSARLLANLDKKFVYAGCVNRDYEGEIKSLGDNVKISKLGDITIKDYDGSDIDAPQDVTSTQVTLTIDKAKYFNFVVKDVDQAQANIELVDKYTGRAGVAMGDVIDTYIAEFTKEAGIKVGSASSPKTVTVGSAYDTLVDLKVSLNKNNVPSEGRFVVVPPEFIGLLEKDPRFTEANASVLENGYKGKVAGFDVYESNNVPETAGKYSILAGTDMAISFAGQVTEIEAYRPEKNFADAVKGLYVYGAKVVEPKAIACLTITIDVIVVS